MLHAKIVDTSTEKIDILKAEKFLSSSNFGAVIYFVGTVRNVNENKKVTGITYDSRNTMVIKSFEEIYKESEVKLKIKNKAVFIEHVKGYVAVKEKSIIIGVGCKHRDEAYNLSKFIIEEIKKRTPIWKKEHYDNEESKWLKGVSIQKN
jgi:molybdopterin synthase catalytic subunit